jgi:hypothetical protein
VRVAFLVPDLGATAGVGAAIAHAAALRGAHDIDARVVLAEPLRHPAAAHPRRDEVPVLALGEAGAEPWDVVLAGDTPSALAAFALHGHARAVLLRDNEASLLDVDDRRRIAAQMITALPVHLLATSRWLADELAALRGGGAIPVVPDPPVDLAVSVPRPVTPGGPLRVLLVGPANDSMAGVGEAIHALAATRSTPYVTWLAPEPVPRPRAVHRVLTEVDARGRAALLADTHVVLHLPRGEGCAAPVLEAFRRGATAVVSPTPSHEELVEHGRSGLIAGFDDIFGTAALVDLLAADPALLETLRAGALRAGAAAPGPARATALLAEQLERLVDAPGVDDRMGAGHLMAYDMIAALADLQNAARRADVAAALHDDLRAQKASIWAERARVQAARARRIKARALRLAGR